MNILKARAKRLDNGEWVYGSLIEYKGGTYIFPHDEENGIWTTTEMYKNTLRTSIHGLYPVNPTTLGYETGRVDKNGRMIYGGMKVRVEFFGYHFFVRWDNKKSAWYLEHSKEPASELSMMLWEKRSEALEIIDEKEEAK
jgi:hypothetical protein